MFRNPATDLIIVLVIVLLVLGPKRLPGLGKGLGQGMREFKDGITGEHKDDDDQPEITQAGRAQNDSGGAGTDPGRVGSDSAGRVGTDPAQPTAGSGPAGPEQRS